MTKIEERNDVLYSALVPDRGNAGTIEGEMLRAINRIVYRDFYNDGDKYNEGYGAETAGHPMTFLMTSEEVPVEIRKFANKIDTNITTSNYTESLEKLLTVIIDYIESKDGNYTESNVDMFDTKSLWENDDYYEDEHEEGCWQDDYYDEDEEFEGERD